ncbi:hypothetical protein [Nocardioides sp. J54]|uniref:hypothetical protein n=1 Tax=Nocardioides sp. J54 TaxID=935866 RepID=UPI0012F87E9F|nr:hypothetical protein [Nocardioides sp. J54]
MAVCMAWLGDPAVVAEVRSAPGPWREMHEAGPGLLLIEATDTLSRVFHEIKWMIPDDCALLVAPLDHRPKARGAAAGTVSWLRSRLPLPDRD